MQNMWLTLTSSAIRSLFGSCGYEFLVCLKEVKIKLLINTREAFVRINSQFPNVFLQRLSSRIGWPPRGSFCPKRRPFQSCRHSGVCRNPPEPAPDTPQAERALATSLPSSNSFALVRNENFGDWKTSWRPFLFRFRSDRCKIWELNGLQQFRVPFIQPGIIVRSKGC